MLVMLTLPSHAEEKQLDDILKENNPPPAGLYAPENCDFQITFPESPYKSKRCPQGLGKCYDLTGYTMVYNLATTLEVNVTCVPSTPANYARYNDRVIRAALKGMVTRANIKDHEINVQESEETRQGSLLGTSKTGRHENIYNAQLWVGQNSIMTVEAKLSGDKNIEADSTFGDIIATIQVKEKVEKAE